MKSTRCVEFKLQGDWYPRDPREPDFVLEEEWIRLPPNNQNNVVSTIRVTFSATREQLGWALFEEVLTNFVMAPEFAEAENDPGQAMQEFPEFIEAYIGSDRGSRLANLARFELALREVAMTAKGRTRGESDDESASGPETPLWSTVNPAVRLLAGTASLRSWLDCQALQEGNARFAGLAEDGGLLLIMGSSSGTQVWSLSREDYELIKMLPPDRFSVTGAVSLAGTQASSTDPTDRVCVLLVSGCLSRSDA